MVLCEEDRILIKNLPEFKGYEAKRLMTEFLTKRWKKTTLNDFLWLLVSAVAEDRELLEKQQTSVMSLGLCPCRGTSFWTFVVIQTIACLRLTWSLWMAINAVVSCYSKCTGPSFSTHSVNTCYKINLGWYPVSSKLMGYTCEQWRLTVYSLYQKL